MLLFSHSCCCYVVVMLLLCCCYVLCIINHRIDSEFVQFSCSHLTDPFNIVSLFCSSTYTMQSNRIWSLCVKLILKPNNNMNKVCIAMLFIKYLLHILH